MGAEQCGWWYRRVVYHVARWVSDRIALAAHRCTHVPLSGTLMVRSAWILRMIDDVAGWHERR